MWSVPWSADVFLQFFPLPPPGMQEKKPVPGEGAEWKKRRGSLNYGVMQVSLFGIDHTDQDREGLERETEKVQ